MKKYILLAAIALTGCAGVQTYKPPAEQKMPAAEKVVAKPRDKVWSELVPQLGKKFFVINNLDKSSGLINVSYSGDPERYVDCGWISSKVKNARGERSWDFPGARASEQYEVMTPQLALLFIDRRMELEGRVNIVLEAMGPSSTRVAVNTRYVVKRDQTFRDVEGRAANLSHTVSFNGGQVGRFPTSRQDGVGTVCRSTGALEFELLDLVH